MWNLANIELLTNLWTAGHSAGHIAGRLGCSRSAVCAKLQRLGLKRGRKPPTAKPRIVSGARRRTVSRVRKSGDTNVSVKTLAPDEPRISVPTRPLQRVIERQPTGHPIEFSKAQLRAMLVEAVRNTV